MCRLTTIRVFMVLGSRYVLGVKSHQLPEKIHLTVTADPGRDEEELNINL